MRKVINIITMISIGGLLLVGCGNSNSKNSNETTATAKEDSKEYTVSSTETSDGKKVKEEEGTVLVNKDSIKTKIADSSGKKLDKDLESQLRPICEELSKITGAKDIEARPLNKTMNFVLYGDVDTIISHKQDIINYLKSKTINGYEQHVMIGSRDISKGESFDIK